MFGRSNVATSTSFLGRLNKGLEKTRARFTGGLADMLRGRTGLDREIIAELENRLLLADIGIEATDTILAGFPARISQRNAGDIDAIMTALGEEMLQLLAPVNDRVALDTGDKCPAVILLVGVNGAGKTTSLGKLANLLKQQGKKPVIAAGDTFRAAAIEQLQAWGERSNIPVIAQQTGSDCAAVIYDALQSAVARNADLVLADTAGRLHNKDNLMEELKKSARAIGKFDPELHCETLLVIDAGTGQNAMNQAQQFNDAVGVDGIILTKLDGTARGGIVFSLVQKLAIPVKFVGVGEQIDDLRPFVAADFVQAFLTEPQ